MRLSRPFITVAVVATVLGMGSAGAAAAGVTASGGDPLGCSDQVFDSSGFTAKLLVLDS